MTLTKLLSSDGYICVNKSVMQKFGITVALILGELCAEYNYWESRNELEDGFFFSTLKNLENETTIKRDTQRKVLELLKEYNVIEVKRKNMPARRFIKINEDKLFDFLKLCSEPENDNDNVDNLNKDVNENLDNSNTDVENSEIQITKKSQTSLLQNSNPDYYKTVNYINKNNINKNNINNNTKDNKLSLVCAEQVGSNNNSTISDSESIKTKPYKLKSNKTKSKNKNKTKGTLGNIEKQYELIDIYFNNGATCNRPDIAKLIKQHLTQRIKKIGYKNYSDTRWENQLKLLIDNAEGDYDYMIQIIQTAILRDYNDLTFPNQKKSLNQFRPKNNYFNNSFDTARNNNNTKAYALFSDEEKEDYKNTKLATDENGNPIEF